MSMFLPSDVLVVITETEWEHNVLHGTSDGQISEEEPARDQGLFGGARRFAHDVQVRRVEAQSSGW